MPLCVNLNKRPNRRRSARLGTDQALRSTRKGAANPMTLGRFLVFFVIGLVLAFSLKLTWLFWILGVALLAVVLKLWLNP